jgi:hypothetical protein
MSLSGGGVAVSFKDGRAFGAAASAASPSGARTLMQSTVLPPIVVLVG